MYFGQDLCGPATLTFDLLTSNLALSIMCVIENVPVCVVGIFDGHVESKKKYGDNVRRMVADNQ